MGESEGRWDDKLLNGISVDVLDKRRHEIKKARLDFDV